MSNQKYIDQLNADKARLASIVSTTQGLIAQNINTIASYESYVDDLYTQNTTLEAEITDLETASANDDVMITFIPPDNSQK